MSADGHDTSCTYRQCAHPESPNPCPFLADEVQVLPDHALPAYLPGDVVLVELYGTSHVILIDHARRNEDGSWSYFGSREGWLFRDEHVRSTIRPSKGSTLHNMRVNRGESWLD